MAYSQSDTHYAANACAPCRSKKRKCDRVLPTCTRCICVKQVCQYDSKPHVNDVLSLEMGGNFEFNAGQLQRIVPIVHPCNKSSLACSKCSTGKRQCSKDIPSCSRCARLGIVCKYAGTPLEDLARLGSRPAICSKELVDGSHTPGSVAGHVATNLSELSTSSNTGGDEKIEDLTATTIKKSLASQGRDKKTAFSVTRRSPSPLTIDHDSHRYLDPFHTYPSNLSRETITQTFHFAIREVWPSVFPGMTYNGKSFTHEWMRSALSCPPLFSAWLHSGAEHLLRQRVSSGVQSFTLRKETYELLLMRQETISSLKEALDDSRPMQLTDEVVMAAFALALHPPERDRGATSRMKMAPLSNLQWLTRFTDIVIMDGDVKGLRNLVQARGGFEKLQMLGLPQGLYTWDLITSSRSLTKPFWPLQTTIQLHSAAEFLSKFEHTDPGLRSLYFLLHSKVSQLMVWIFHALRGYSALLQGYAVGSHSDLDLGYILELRNYVHYHILSIPAGMSVGMESVSHIYEPFRLALTIYSLLVLFPIPLATSPYFNLTQLLHRELEVVPKEEWSSMPTLLLWVLTLGGIAALDTPHRPWFVTRLHVQLEELGIISWKGFVHTMGTWIWLGSPCGTEGLILWKEAQEYGSH